MPAPAPAAVAETTASSKSDDVPRPSWKLCLGLGVGGAAALLAGAVLGGLAKARSNEQEGSVDSPPLYDEHLASRGRQGDRMATSAYVLLSIGGALAISDIVLWVERLRKPPKKKADAAHAFAPTISPLVSGLKVSF